MDNLKNLQVKFAPNVLLMDVALINTDVAHMRRAMSLGLKRELPMIDMLEWIPCLGLDGGVQAFGMETQVILVHESPETVLSVAAQPDFLQHDGNSFLVPMVSEFQISCVHPAGFTDTNNLFFDLMHILLDCKDVKNLMLLPSPQLYGDSVADELHKLVEEKGNESVEKVCLFSLLPEKEEPYRQANVAMSLAHVFGIKREDLH